MILQSSGEIFTTEEIEILEEYGEPSSPGTYYYGACVDAVTGKSDTKNNCSGAVEVEVTSP